MRNLCWSLLMCGSVCVLSCACDSPIRAQTTKPDRSFAKKTEAKAVAAINENVHNPRFELHKSGHVKAVAMSSTFVKGPDGDGVLALVKRITKLQSLFVDSSAVSDAGLVHLRDMDQLKSLFVSSRMVTDKGLIHLKGLRNLKQLTLDYSNIKGDGLVHLAGLANLETLMISGAHKMRGDGLQHLKTNKNLRTIKFRSAALTDHVLSRLKHLPQITTLHLEIGNGLANTEFTGTALAVLKDLPNLRELNLAIYRWKCMRECMKHLAKAPSLRRLRIRYGSIPAANDRHWKSLGAVRGLALIEIRSRHGDHGRYKQLFSHVRTTLKKMLPKTKVVVH